MTRQIKAILAPSNNPKLRVESAKHFMARHNGFVISSEAKWTLDGLRSGYQYAKIKNTSRYQDLPEKNEWSHAVDGLCYATLYLRQGASQEAQMGPAVSSAVTAFKKRMRVARSLV
jgi:hypothetical protein